MEILEFLIANFKAGGVFMYAILFVLACGTAIIIERGLTLFVRARINARDLWRRVVQQVEKGNLHDAFMLCQKSAAPLGKVLAAGLRTAAQGRAAQEVGNAVEETMLAVLPNLEKRIHYLYSLSNISTLLGLLGTVVGLIRSFTAVSLADPSQKASLLASGISLALNNTAFGLLVAIVLMISYSVMQSRGAKLGGDLDEYSMRLLNLLNARSAAPRIAGGAHPPHAAVDSEGT